MGLNRWLGLRKIEIKKVDLYSNFLDTVEYTLHQPFSRAIWESLDRS